MHKIILLIPLYILSLYAETYDSTYSCIALEKISNNQTEKLDMKQSLAQGGYLSFSMKINFLRAEVVRNKNTLENIDYPPMRFAYRADVMDFVLYVYDYNRDYFVIEKGYKKEPRFTMTLENGDRLRYACRMWEKIRTDHENR